MDYSSTMRENKRNFFKEILTPYINDSVLDTKRLKENHKLDQEFHRAYKTIRAGCEELGIYPSRVAKARAEKPS